jgi:hypothetical protein
MALGGLFAAGVTLSDRAADWPYFPAPGGLIFPLLALATVIWLQRATRSA